MRVRARERGYDGVAVREEGEEFDLPDMVTVVDPVTNKRMKNEDGSDKLVTYVLPESKRRWFDPVEETDEKPKGKGRG